MQVITSHVKVTLTGHVTRHSPQWGAADAEIKVPYVENTEHKGSPFKAWSRSVYSHTRYAYYQGLVISTLFFFFFQNLSRVFPVLAVANSGSRVGPHSKIYHPAYHYRQLRQVPVLSAHGI